MSIGNRISELRKQFNYSQEYVAEQLDVSRQAVSKWEQDQTAPDTNNLIALAQLFRVSVEYLATGKEIEVPQCNDNRKDKTDTHKKIIGYILLGCGLLSLILGLLFSVVLIVLSAYFLVGAFIILVFKKPSLLITLWIYYVMVLATLSMTTGFNPLVIFYTETYSQIFNGEFNINIIVTFLIWILLIGLLSISIIKIVRNKRKTQTKETQDL